VKARKTVVFVTHDVREALMLATRLVLMAARPGRIIRDVEVRLQMPRLPENKDLMAMERDIRALMKAHTAVRESSLVQTAGGDRLLN
jgi:NitT/TauT family transport system ATP-binding protein